MRETNRKPILITGSHRSGSTWVGRVVALSPSVGYIHEPFNLRHRPGICKAKFNFWFPYICNENKSLYSQDIEDCIRFKFQFMEGLKAAKSIKDFARLLRDCINFKRYEVVKRRPLLKDPIAVFSAEWLASRFGMDVIVLIRHPAAFVASLKKGNSTFPFDHFLQQPLLMQHHLCEYRSEIEEYSKKEFDIVDQGILLWKLIHHVILKYRENNHAWVFARHEDLSRCPEGEFSRIYSRLGLTFSADVRQRIRRLSFAEQSKEDSGSLVRNSKSNIWTWKTRLTDDEIARIKDNTDEIASQFYTEEDWTYGMNGHISRSEWDHDSETTCGSLR